MNNNEQNPFFDKTIQNAIFEVFACEWIARDIFMQAVTACKDDERCAIAELCEDACEASSRHLSQLRDWCAQYGYDIPRKQSEFKKYASAAIRKEADQMKTKKDAGYYIDVIADTTEYVERSYVGALKGKGVFQYTDLQSLLYGCFYDWQNKVENIKTSKIAYDANVSDLIIS